MPHDVIMPALGMAQDKGLIVAWLKHEGDAVSEGDALFEVETDKATMEVEAQGAGFLTNVTAGEGDSVPVGNVIAQISDTAEAKGTGQGAPKTSDAKAEDAGDAPPPQGRKVIMPALGMAQDTGRIVDWIVAAGDAVQAGDALFEVETDKATMEVEAETGGYVAAIYAEAGDDVPVGDTIAIISDSKPDAPVSRKAAPKPTAAPASTDAPAPPAAKAATKTPASGGRILASPKARRLARERGIDLAVLARAGVAQPFHAADLDRPEAVPPAAMPAPQPATGQLRLTARAPADAFDAFADWAATQGTDRQALVATLASGALREATGADPIAIELRPSGQCLQDADLTRATDPDDTSPALILRDLTATRLTALDGAGDAMPILTLTRDGGDLVATLSAPPDAMGEATATDMLAGFADRIADPLRQLF